MISPSKVFFVDGESVYTYGDLLSFVSSADSFVPIAKTNSAKDHFYNLVSALAIGADIVLLDGDSSDAEINCLGLDNVNIRKSSPKKSYANVEELIRAVETSSSKITLFTSGTTGLPKKVSHTISGLSRLVRKSVKYSENRWGLAYNPSHMAGLQVFFQAFSNGNEMVELFGKQRNEIFYLVDSRKITNISATPTFFRLLLPENKTYPTVLRLTCGGEKSDNILYSKLEKIFPNAKINNIYASTEFGSLLVSSGECFEIPEDKTAAIKIVDGELTVCKDLLGASDILGDGQWYRTGDIVEFVDKEKKRFRFLARSSNLLNVGGYKVNLEEVEDEIRKIPQVSETVVYGRNNSVLGNILCADIKVVDGETLSAADVRSFLSERFRNFKIPRKINFTDFIKSTRTGKIQR